MRKRNFFITSFLVMFLIAAWGHAALAQTADGLKIKSVKEVGRTIELTDGSVWSIENPADQEVAYTWLPYQDITVLNGTELRNNHSGQRIDAKMVEEGVAPKSTAVPSSAPAYSAQAGGKPGSRPPAAMSHPADVQVLEKILKRLDSLEAKLQVMDWRLRKMEKETLAKP